MKSNLKTKGYTLIELMVVIVIIALLVAVAIPVYKQYAYASRINATVPIIQRQLDIWVEQTLLGNSVVNTMNNPTPDISSIVSSSSGVIATLNQASLSFMTGNLAVSFVPTITGASTTWTATYPPNIVKTSYMPTTWTCPLCC